MSPQDGRTRGQRPSRRRSGGAARRTARGGPGAAGAGPLVGTVVELEVGPVAHGGHCVARLDGRVVFVRHALPGERVRARLTEAGEGQRLWRADAVEALRPSEDRVLPACPVAGPGACGGCDFQHVTPEGQRRLKAAVLREQMQRLASLDVDVEVEEVPLPGVDPEAAALGLGWRTRVTHAVDDEGRLGFRAYRDHRVVPVAACPIASPAINDLQLPASRWRGWSAVEVVAPAGTGERLVVATAADEGKGGEGKGGEGKGGEGQRGRPDVPPRQPAGVSVATAPPHPPRGPVGPLQRVAGRTWVREVVDVAPHDPQAEPRGFRVTGTGFWQVHPSAAPVLVQAVLEALQPRPGERALDLFSGAGLFTAALAEAVGTGGEVVAVEGDERAVADARRNVHDLPQVRLEHGRVDRVLAAEHGGDGGDSSDVVDPAGGVDVVVLDPPRSGAGREVVEQVLRRAPRAVAYVACDPAALARDVATAVEHGYELAGLRAFDLFPNTHHLEAVALLRPARDRS